MTAAEFKKKWSRYQAKESAAYQAHFIACAASWASLRGSNGMKKSLDIAYKQLLTEDRKGSKELRCLCGLP